jgi:hypothetical protein
MAVLLSDGRLLVAGGRDQQDNLLSSAESFISPPAVSVSTSNLEFGVQLVHTPTAEQGITLSVRGTNPLTISGIATSGDFLERNDCGSSVPAGGSCTIRVAFQPKQKYSRTGTITITDDAVTSPQTITLTGIGTVVAVSATGLDFGDQKVGTKSQPQTITVTNVGTAPLHFWGLSITGKNAADFAENNTCGVLMTRGDSCVVNITFRPLAKGARQAHTAIINDGGGSPQRVVLVGNGV